jgi:O-antigen/teichoic acid export membrane protein
MGFIKLGSAGLILSNLIGQLLITTLLGQLLYNRNKSVLKSLHYLKIIALAKRYVNFPKFDLMASFTSVFSNQLIHILFNTIFASTIAGFYYLTQKVLGLPITIIAQAIGDIFKQKASEDYRDYNNAKSIYLSTLKKLFILALFPSIILYFFSIEIFTLIFGSDWYIAGEFVQIMVPMLFLKFISSPLSFMLYIGEKQHINMYNQLLFLLATLISFLVGQNEFEILNYITISFSFIYLYYLYISAKIAKVF